jgi:hypothetical protein
MGVVSTWPLVVRVGVAVGLGVEVGIAEGWAVGDGWGIHEYDKVKCMGYNSQLCPSSLYPAGCQQGLEV